MNETEHDMTFETSPSGTIKTLECYQFKPLWALHQGSTAS